MNTYVHSFAILLNSFSMTALMMFCGLAGAPGLTADIAIVQGSTMALFFAFSANARNVIFADTSGSAPCMILRARLCLIAPLAVLSFFLSSVVGPVNASLALVLIVRRCAEWVGEVFLSSHEVQDCREPTVIAIVVEGMTFVMTVILLFAFEIDPAVAMSLWAIAPLVALVKGKLAKVITSENITQNLKRLTPNLGSTAIIGVAVYVFRLSITLLVGHAVAGDLFTAFAIGGLLPTIYNSSIGPSLALKYHRNGLRKETLKRLFPFATGLFLSGFFVSIISLLYPQIDIFLGKSNSFWLSVGLSLSGGAVMIFALHMRIRMLQYGKNVEIFGADAISNVLIVVAVPYFYHILGLRSLEGLYLFSAFLTLFFYWSAMQTKDEKFAFQPVDSKLLFAIASFVVFPVFFQLSGGIFRDSTFIFDTGRMLKQLPIPISVFALGGGILLLGRFRDAQRSLMVFFFTAIMLVMSALFVKDQNAQADRLVLMAQYLLPFLGLVLGEMYGSASENGEFEKTCLAVVCVIIPLQLLFSWFQGLVILTPYLYFFSIYQHLHYVSVTLVLVYGIALGSLWKKNGKWRIVLLSLLPWIAIYVAASYTATAIVAFLGSVIILLMVLDRPALPRRFTTAILIFSVIVGASYGIIIRTPLISKMSTGITSVREVPIKKNQIPFATLTPKNIAERMEHWIFFGSGVLSGIKELFLGHVRPPDRKLYSSAHNYYLDILYNFGLLALAPLLSLLIYTIYSLYRFHGSLLTDPSFFGLVFAVFIVFMVENSLKVGLRQPYPGIFGFFLLGYLQARFSRLSHTEGFPN